MEEEKQILRPTRILSGGQTGVDRAALDAAMLLGIAHGGWCPRGRPAEDGAIPAKYELKEMSSSHYSDRTERNVLDSDATLILHQGEIGGGTLLTQKLAERHGRPWLAVNLNTPACKVEVHRWLQTHSVKTLNIAGPRESQNPGIGQLAQKYLLTLFDREEDRRPEISQNRCPNSGSQNTR